MQQPNATCVVILCFSDKQRRC